MLEYTKRILGVIAVPIPFKKQSIILAPMAGVTDSGFRKICKKYGADITYSEMVSTKGIFYKDKKSYELLKYTDNETPISLQIFGNDPECFKVATEYINNNYSPMSIDINMGCPAPKIFNNGDGCALMKQPETAFKIIKSVKDNTDIPVSIKFRAGVDENNLNAVEFAKVCQNAGADYLTVHGRTRSQFYSGKSDKSIIKSVVEAVTIPVIANGDIIDYTTAKDTIDFTGAHSLMVGRASMGNPLVFNQIKSGFNLTKKIEITPFEIFDIALEHLSNVINDKGEFLAVKEFRKHILWYLKGVKNASKYKQISCTVSTYSDCKQVFEQIKKEI